MLRIKWGLVFVFRLPAVDDIIPVNHFNEVRINEVKDLGLMIDIKANMAMSTTYSIKDTSDIAKNLKTYFDTDTKDDLPHFQTAFLIVNEQAVASVSF